MALEIPSQHVSTGKLRAPNPEPIPSYEASGKVAWITLDEPDHMNATHTIGDVLRGKVHIKPKQQTTITFLAIYFKCKIATGLTEREGIPFIYKWNDILFSESIKHIDSLTGTTLSGEYEYPFSFDVPSTTPSDVAQMFPPRLEPSFEVGQGRPLPPSFHWSYASHSERIVYYLEVRAKCKGRLHRDIKDKLPIQFSPARQTLNPDLQLKSYQRDIVRQSNLLGSLTSTGQRGSTKNSDTQSESNPTGLDARFSLAGTVPSALYVGGPVPIQIALNGQSGFAPRGTPEVHLCKVFVRLTAWTIFRVAVKGWLKPSHIIRTADEKIDLVNATLTKPLAVPSDGQPLQLDQVISGFAMKPDMKPTFKSCAISRWYDLKVSVEVSVGGQHYPVEICKHRCQVQPALYRPEAGDTRPGQAEDEEPLPLYAPREEEDPGADPPAFSPT